MRAFHILKESLVGEIQSRFSQVGTPVYKVISRLQLENLAKKAEHKNLRMMLEPDGMMVWDAAHATHRNAEEILGFGGPRMGLSFLPDGKVHIEYNVNDITPRQIKVHPLFKKFFTKDELNDAEYWANEV